MKITLDEVRQTAALARLALTEEEAARLKKEMDGILGYMDSLAALDVTGVAGTTHAVAMDMPLRPDTPFGQLTLDEALSGAPRREAGFFEVPRIIAHDKDA